MKPRSSDSQATMWNDVDVHLLKFDLLLRISATKKKNPVQLKKREGKSQFFLCFRVAVILENIMGHQLSQISIIPTLPAVQK